MYSLLHWIFDRLYKNRVGRMAACPLVGAIVAVESVVEHSDLRLPLWAVAAGGGGIGLLGGFVSSLGDWFAQPEGLQQKAPKRARFGTSTVLFVGSLAIIVIVIHFIVTVFF